MGKVISIINMKGGVGKTTLSTGIADYLSAKNKILLIDADPQFNATQALLDMYKPEKLEQDENFYSVDVLPKNRTIYRLFRPEMDLGQAYSMPKASDIIINLSENFDILCGDLNLVLADQYSNIRYVKRIRNFIEDNKLKNTYDYIFIDCPPTLTIYTNSALMASDYYLIPNRIDRYSIVGIDSLQKAISNIIAEEHIPLKCIGLVYTMISTNPLQKQQRIKTNFESKQVVKEIDIFSASLAECRDIQCGVAGAVPTKYKKSRDDIEAISEELLQKIASQSQGKE